MIHLSMASFIFSLFTHTICCKLLTALFAIWQIEMIYKIIAHMAANDRALIAEGNCGTPHSIKVYLGECNVDDLYA